MEIKHILYSLKHNKTGPILICLQLALTLALLVNSMIIVSATLDKMGMPLGIDVDNLYSFNSALPSEKDDMEDFLKNDLAQIRAIVGVIDATLVQSFLPFGGVGNFRNSPDTNDENYHQVTTNQIDEHGLSALGIDVLAGRNFRSDEVVYVLNDEAQEVEVVIITESYGRSLFPDDELLSMVGRYIYEKQTNKPVEIIGIISDVANSNLVFSGGEFAQKNGYYYLFQSVLTPLAAGGYNYIVRTEPENQNRLIAEVDAMLIDINPNRLIYDPIAYSDFMSRLFSFQSGMATVLATISLLLVIVSGLGIVGLASYTVNQRQRQIGIRRALGAKRWDIMRYFLLENFLLTTVGAIFGGGLAFVIHLVTYEQLGLTKMGVEFLIIGIIFLYGLGFLAVFFPAKRAASISPAMATRAV